MGPTKIHAMARSLRPLILRATEGGVAVAARVAGVSGIRSKLPWGKAEIVPPCHWMIDEGRDFSRR